MPLENQQGENQNEKEIQFTNDERYLYLPKSAYEDKFNYAEGESIEDRIKFLLENIPGSKEARKIMAENVKKLYHKLSTENSDLSFDAQLTGIILEISLASASNLPEKGTEKALGFIQGLYGENQLLKHLTKDVGDSTVAITTEIKDVIKDEDGLFTPKQAILLEFIARTHDLCKLLGGLNAQIDPDHEVIYREVVGRFLVGKKFISSSGEKIIFDEKDAEFIRKVVGNHEDIWREEQFAKEADSLNKTNGPVSMETSVSRARSIMHVIDIFGNAVRFDKGELKMVDEGEFKKRFIDLFQRHIKMPIAAKESGLVDWTIAKVTRPEWGLHGVAGLTKTFELLAEWGIKVDPNLIKQVQEGIKGVLQNAHDSLLDGLTHQNRYETDQHPGNTLARIIKAQEALAGEMK